MVRWGDGFRKEAQRCPHHVRSACCHDSPPRMRPSSPDRVCLFLCWKVTLLPLSVQSSLEVTAQYPRKGGILLHLLDGKVSTETVQNPSEWEICLFLPIYSFIQSFIFVSMES